MSLDTRGHVGKKPQINVCPYVPYKTFRDNSRLSATPPEIGHFPWLFKPLVWFLFCALELSVSIQTRLDDRYLELKTNTKPAFACSVSLNFSMIDGVVYKPTRRLKLFFNYIITQINTTIN